jgi:hypothetical protein
VYKKEGVNVMLVEAGESKALGELTKNAEESTSNRLETVEGVASANAK